MATNPEGTILAIENTPGTHTQTTTSQASVAQSLVKATAPPPPQSSCGAATNATVLHVFDTSRDICGTAVSGVETPGRCNKPAPGTGSFEQDRARHFATSK